MTDKMLERRDGAIGHLVFNQPEKRNAVSLAMWERASAILDAFEADPGIRVLVLSGAVVRDESHNCFEGSFGQLNSNEEQPAGARELAFREPRSH